MSTIIQKPNRYSRIFVYFFIVMASLLPFKRALAQESCSLQAFLVADGDFSNTQKVDQIFKKTWSIRNDGRCHWPRDLALVLVRGDRMSGPSRMPLTIVGPGEILEINIDLQAPGKAGQYSGVWQLEAQGVRFGPSLRVGITVIHDPDSLDNPNPPQEGNPGPLDEAPMPEIVTVQTEDPVVIQPGAYGSAQVECEEGVVTGGGWSVSAEYGGARIHESIPLYGGWLVSVFNYGSEAVALTANANCLINTQATQLIMFNVVPVAPNTASDYVVECPGDTVLAGGGVGMPPAVGMFMSTNQPGSTGIGWRGMAKNQNYVPYDMLVFANCLIGLNGTNDVFSEVFYVTPSSPAELKLGTEGAQCPAGSLPASGGNGEVSSANYYMLIPGVDGWSLFLLNEWLIELNFRVSVNCLTFP